MAAVTSREFKFVTKDNHEIKIILDQKPRVDFGRLQFSFTVESKRAVDSEIVLSVLSQVIKVILVKPSREAGNNRLEWSGQASIEGSQLLDIAQSYLKDQYEIEPFEISQHLAPSWMRVKLPIKSRRDSQG
jgi:hypothetical protein